MNKALKDWFGQATTAHGIMVLVPTVLAVLGGSMSWRQAAPLLIAGAIGLIWPENTAQRSDARSLAMDVARLTASVARREKTLA